MKKVVVVKKQNGQKKTVAPPQKRRKGFISRCVDIIIKDIQDKIHGVKSVVEDEPDGWETYKRFCELARGERK